MGKIVNSTFVSLDGVINHMDRWHFDFIDAETDAFALQQLRESDALLMGRDTYDVYASTWPGRDSEHADRINAMTKYVASTTLKTADWANTTILEGDLIEEVTKLKQDRPEHPHARVRPRRQDADAARPARRAVPVGPPHAGRRRNER